MKILYNKDWYTSTNELHKELKLLKVVDMYKQIVMKFVHRCKMNNIPEVFRDYFTDRSKVHNYNTRYSNLYEIPKFQSYSYGGRTVRYMGSNIYNKIAAQLVAEIEIMSINTLLLKVKTLLILLLIFILKLR